MAVVSNAHLERYAEASGDHNAIHLDEKVAKAMGLPGVIAHGMLVAGWISERALRFGETHGKGKIFVSKINVRFRAMVFPGDRISVGGTFKVLSPQVWHLDLQAKNQKGEVTTSAAIDVTIQ